MPGRREEDDLLEFISRFLPERVITLWPGNYDKWVKGERHTWDSVGEGGNCGPATTGVTSGSKVRDTLRTV